MRLRCHLKMIRGARSLREVAIAAGVAPGELSRIENGVAVPRDKNIPALERAYEAGITDWYPPSVLLALEAEDDAAVTLARRMRIAHG